MPLIATIFGAIAFWNDWSAPRKAITVFLGVMFTMCVGVSLSIGFDRRIQSPPWLRIGAVLVFILLGCGVTWVRGKV
ncbi:hypothetical protein AB0C07_09710 [Actinoplanes missouriensis]|uniref:hypothetical protein n=1 Tax=Actinoplanes missouriensis TaxID=1866 RepID=UPI00340C43F1